MSAEFASFGYTLVGFYFAFGLAKAHDRVKFSYPHSHGWVKELCKWWSLAAILVVFIQVIS